MYAMKSYFLVDANDTQIQQVLARYPELKKAEVKVVSEKELYNVQVLEVDDIALIDNLKQEFASQQQDFWKVPQQVDFAVTLPEKNCNSFVLPIYGNFQDAGCWAEKWQTASWKETRQFYSVLISCYKTSEASWVEFRGHSMNPDADWFNNIRKICKNFTKSVPTFFFAERMS